MNETPTPDPAPERASHALDGTRRLGAGASGVLSLLLVGSLFAVPLFGLALAPLGLIPILHYQASARRWYLAWAWVVVMLVAACVLGFGGLAAPLLAAYMVLVMIPSLSVQWWRILGFSEGRWAAATAAVGAVSTLVVVALLSAPETPMAAVAAWLRSAAAEAQDFYNAMGFARGELELALDALELYASWALPMIPVAYLVAVLFWIRPRLPLLGFAVPAGAFEEYRSEEWLPAAFALFGGATLLLDSTARWVALNLLGMVLILYFVHGLAIIRAHLARWVGRGWLVRWGAVFLCLQMPLPPLVAILGLTDSFRSLRPPVKDDGGQQ